MIINENTSEDKLLKEINEENLKNYNNNEEIDNMNNENTNYENLSTFDIFLILLKQSIVLVLLMILGSLKFTLLFIFSKSVGTEFLAAISLVLPIYSIILFAVPWAITQYYGYKTSQYYSQNSIKNLGLIFNKSMFFNIFIAVIFTICFYTIIPLILSHFLENQTSIKYLYTFCRSLGISIIFQFWQIVLVFYFMSIEYYFHLPILEIIGLVVQIIFQLIIVVGLKNHVIGIGISYALGMISVVILNTLYFVYKNKISNGFIQIRLDETFDRMFSEFVPISLRVGIVVFLNSIAFEIVPLVSIVIFNTSEFTAVGILVNIFLLFNSFNEAIKSSNNFLINRCIGKNEYKLFKSVLIITALIIISYTIFTIVILLSFFDNLIYLYTNDLEIIANILKLKYSFIFLVSTSTIINFLCENLVIFEDYNVSLINLICFRLIGTISLSIISHNFWNWGINSLFLSCAINNSLIVIINYFRLSYIVSSKIEEMKKKIE